MNALLAHCGDTLPGIGGERRPGIVHRLDRDTSGVMVVAKTETALARLSADFAARDLERAYLALCWGAARARHGRGRGRRSAATRATASAWPCVRSGGKAALTRYRTLAAHAWRVAELELHLATGRTHQIRVHMAASRPPAGRRPDLPAPHPGRRPRPARAAAPRPARLPAPGAARRPPRLHPPGHRRRHAVRGAAAAGHGGAAGAGAGELRARHGPVPAVSRMPRFLDRTRAGPVSHPPSAPRACSAGGRRSGCRRAGRSPAREALPRAPLRPRNQCRPSP